MFLQNLQGWNTLPAALNVKNGQERKERKVDFFCWVMVLKSDLCGKKVPEPHDADDDPRPSNSSVRKKFGSKMNLFEWNFGSKLNLSENDPWGQLESNPGLENPIKKLFRLKKKKCSGTFCKQILNLSSW
jgi:hypothetical protein